MTGLACPKPKREMDAKLCEWIRQLPCVICGGRKFPNEVSHVKSRGSGGGDRSNVLSMCRKDHAWFEDLPTTKKRKLIYFAEMLTHDFDNANVPVISIGLGRNYVDKD